MFTPWEINQSHKFCLIMIVKIIFWLGIANWWSCGFCHRLYHWRGVCVVWWNNFVSTCQIVCARLSGTLYRMLNLLKEIKTLKRPSGV